MRIAKNLLLVAAMLLMLSGVSQAAFDNSHHDMRSYYTAVATKEGCAHCHGRQSAQAFTSIALELGGVGGLCLQRCHSGTGLIGAIGAVVPQAPVAVDDRNYATVARPIANYNTVYFGTGSHGNLPARLTNVGGGAISWPPATANTWPYMATAITQIECTSCHAVHDNLNAPFLWAPMGPTSVGTATGFCDRCHSEATRSNNFLTNAPNGNHPINFIVDNVAAAARTDVNGRSGRRIIFQAYNALRVFDVANPAASTMIGPPSVGTAWNTGGHLVVPGAPATQNTTAMPTVGTGTTTAVMGCFTCHSAHKTSVYGENNLVNVATIDNTGTWNPLCVGCHGSSTDRAGDSAESGVGSRTQYGHPVGAGTTPVLSIYTSSIGNFKFMVNTALTFSPRQLVTGFGTGGALLCTTCHQVHGGATGSMALAVFTPASTNAICKRCHNGVGIPNVQDASKGGTMGDAGVNRANMNNAHHVTAATVTNGMTKTGSPGTVLTVNNPSWAGTITRGPGLGAILTSGMDCADCHTFNGTAHNW